jgi:hypothetical protein
MLKGYGRKRSWPNLNLYPAYARRAEETMKTSSQDSRCPNQAPPYYKSEELLLKPICSVVLMEVYYGLSALCS